MPPLLTPLSESEAPEAVRRIFHLLQARLGAVFNLYRMMGHAPEVLRATLEMDRALQDELPGKLRELASLRVSQITGCHACLHYHRRQGRKLGLTEEQIQDMEGFESSAAFGDLEKNVLRFATQWSTQARVAPDLVRSLARELTPAQLVTLAATCTLVGWTSKFNVTFSGDLP